MQTVALDYSPGSFCPPLFLTWSPKSTLAFFQSLFAQALLHLPGMPLSGLLPASFFCLSNITIHGTSLRVSPAHQSEAPIIPPIMFYRVSSAHTCSQPPAFSQSLHSALRPQRSASCLWALLLDVSRPWTHVARGPL